MKTLTLLAALWLTQVARADSEIMTWLQLQLGDTRYDSMSVYPVANPAQRATVLIPTAADDFDFQLDATNSPQWTEFEAMLTNGIPGYNFEVDYGSNSYIFDKSRLAPPHQFNPVDHGISVTTYEDLSGIDFTRYTLDYIIASDRDIDGRQGVLTFWGRDVPAPEPTSLALISCALGVLATHRVVQTKFRCRRLRRRPN